MMMNRLLKNPVVSMAGDKAKQYFLLVFFEQLITVICLNVVIAFATQDTVTAASEQNIAYLYRGMVILGISMVIAVSFLPLCGYFANRCVKQIVSGIRMDVFRHISEAETASLDQIHSGELVSRYTSDVNSIENLYLYQIKKFVAVCMIGPISVSALLALDWRLGLLVLLFGAATVVLNTFFGKRMRKVSTQEQAAVGRAGSRLMDLLDSMEFSKIMNAEKLMHKHYSDAARLQMTHSTKRVRLHATVIFAARTIFYLRQVIIIGVGILLMMNGYITIGTVVASSYLLVNASYMFDNISEFYTDVQKSMASVERLQALMCLESEAIDEPELPDAGSVKENASALFMEQVEFRYPGADSDTLHALDLTISKGEYAALVGPSGNGKSTVIKLLLGLYPFSGGQIQIEGRDIRSYSLRRLRAVSGYVQQKPYLFEGTVRENIRFGNLEATEEEMVSASKLAHCHQYIVTKLDSGYDTQVGEDGGNLSGGQRQRIAIARALLKNPSLLLLDEPTAALDPESERQVMETLCRLKGKMAILIVTHRLHTVADCDTIYVIESGSVSAKGTHAQLLKDNETYRTLHCQ